MIEARPLHPVPGRPRALNDRALEDLGFIRSTMERAAAYTAIPGWGGVLMGACALAALPFALGSATRTAWFEVWMTAACVACGIGALEMHRKARAEGVSLLRGAGSRFAKALAPGLVAGAILTLVLRRLEHWDLLPGCWLLLYGVAVTAAGAFSIRAVRAMGAAFVIVGAIAFAGVFVSSNPTAFGDVCMAGGFGALHVIYGVSIAREHRG